MQEEMDRLLELARIDEDLAEMKESSAHLPEEAGRLEAKKEALAEAVREKEAELEDLSKRRRHEERDLEDLKAKLEVLKKRQLEIKTNEEYAALVQEIKYAERNISETEDRILEMLEQAEALEGAIGEAREEMERSIEGIETELKDVRQRIREVEERLEVRADERKRVAMHIDPSVLDRYNRILASKGDSAMASIEGETCSGCYVKLPPQTVIEVKKTKRIIECESCGRILCWVPEGSDGTS